MQACLELLPILRYQLQCCIQQNQIHVHKFKLEYGTFLQEGLSITSLAGY